MDVNIDGLRRNLSKDVNKLAYVIESILDELSPDSADELKNAYEDVATDAGVFNCVYSDKIENFTMIDDQINIKRFDLE